MIIKKFHITILLLLPIFLNAQKMISLDNLWYVWDPGIDWSGTLKNNFAVFFKDSSEINGRYYYQLYSTLDSTFQGIKPLKRFFREEKGMVYRLSEFSDKEDLIYNFNLNPGDSIVFGENPYDLTAKVLTVDTIELFDGSKRKRFTVYDKKRPINRYNNMFYWIEGIGAERDYLFGPTGMFYFDSRGTGFECFFIKNQLVYGGYNKMCKTKLGYIYDPVGTKSISELKGIQLIQNTGDGNIVFRLENVGKYTFSFYNAQGAVLRNQVAAYQGDNRLSIAEFPQGVYFVQVYDLERHQQKTFKVFRH